jgi:hypothetical protein
VAACYIAGMLALAQDARRFVITEWQERTGQPARALMVGPVPVLPWRREVIIDAGDRYRTGTYTAWPRRLDLAETPIAKNDRLDSVAAARATRGVAAFLVWARFPYWEVMPSPGGTEVTVRDMRFRATGPATFMATATVPGNGSE